MRLIVATPAAHGFEGVGVASKRLKPGDLSSSDRPYVPEMSVDCHAAGHALDARMRHHHHALAVLNEALWVRAERLAPDLPQTRHIRPDAIMATVGPLVQHQARRLDLNVVGTET